MPDSSILNEQQSTSVPAILQSLIFSDNILLKLNGIDVVLNACDDAIGKALDTNAIRESLHKLYLDDINFMRKLKLYSKMMENTETALELMGQDYLTHQEFSFDEDFEKILSGLNKQLNKIIGQLLKAYMGGVEVEY
jgi:hypothetical protein